MSLEVHVVTPEREVWSGDATLVVARGVEGDVGIMAQHAPLLIRLAVGPLTVRREGEDLLAVVDGGFLHVTSADEAVAFTAATTTESGENWLTVTPAAGSTPATLTVSVNSTRTRWRVET